MHRFSYLILAILVSSCIFNRQSVNFDYSVTGDFYQYQSFTIIPNTEIEQTDQQVIETSIYRRLKSMGYNYVGLNPSLYVSYKIYHERFRMKSYDQIPLNTWLTTGGENAQYKADVKNKSDLVDGETILINIYDPFANECVWRGYCSIREPRQSYRELVFSINQILDEFVIRQDKPKQKVFAKVD